MQEPTSALPASKKTAPTTTIAAACFATPPALDFQSFADEVAQALGASQMRRISVSRGYEDIAIVDIDGARLSLAYCDITMEPDLADAAPDVAAVLVVAVGSNACNDAPENVACPLFDNRYRICAGLIERVECMRKADMLIWLEENRDFDQDVFDTLLDGITCKPEPARSIFPDLAAQEDLQPTHPPHYGATHKRQSVEMAHIREDRYSRDTGADSPPHARPLAGPRDMPLPHRLTIYTINATLMVIALPVGAAVMTYCALGRESLSVAARAMALTGAAIGISQLDAMQGLLAFVG